MSTRQQDLLIMLGVGVSLGMCVLFAVGYRKPAPDSHQVLCPRCGNIDAKAGL